MPPCRMPKLSRIAIAPDVRHQQVQEAGAADLGDAVLRRHEEIRRQRHRLPGDHERVGVVGQQHEPHAGEEQVVLEAHHPGRGALALAEVPRREQRHADGRAPEQRQEDAGEGIEPHVHGQVGQADSQRGALHRAAQGRQRNDREAEADDRTEGKQHPADERDARGPQQSGCADEGPAREQREAGGKGRVHREHGRLCYPNTNKIIIRSTHQPRRGHRVSIEERTARLTVLIDPRKKALFERLCAEQDTTPSQVVRQLIRGYIEERTGMPWTSGLLGTGTRATRKR